MLKSMKENIKINGKKYVDYTESDLRFSGWEDECIIINRCENHYLIPLDRYVELKTPKIKQETLIDKSKGVYGCFGCTGIVGSPKNI